MRGFFIHLNESIEVYMNYRLNLAVILSVSFLMLMSCNRKSESVWLEHNGQAQGTTYQIKYMSPDYNNYAEDIRQIFRDIDHSMSTWDPNSIITKVNKGDTLVVVDQHFMTVLKRSVGIAEETGGDFDPTIGPAVRLWGFGFDEVRQDVTQEMVDSVLELTGYRFIEYDEEEMTVRIPEGFQVDFNAIAQGYTVDYIAEYLEERGVDRYMVEVGGEVRTRGTNPDTEAWRIGVDKPQEEIDQSDRFQFILELNEAALATSGNYRKFWVDEETGTRYSHTIDPETGYPARNQLLSVSIITDNAMDADAYATVCMVKGTEACKAFLAEKDELEGYLIYAIDENTTGTFSTDGFQELITDTEKQEEE